MKVFVGKANSFNSLAFLFASYDKQYCQKNESLIVQTNSFGKPYFQGKGKPYFSLSHSGDYIVCVFYDHEIGIDIQKLRKVPLRTAKRYLKTESSDLLDLVVEWTKFESFGKRIGIGIPYDDDYTRGRFLTNTEIENYAITVCVDNDCKENMIELVFIE